MEKKYFYWENIFFFLKIIYFFLKNIIIFRIVLLHLINHIRLCFTYITNTLFYKKLGSGPCSQRSLYFKFSRAQSCLSLVPTAAMSSIVHFSSPVVNLVGTIAGLSPNLMSFIAQVHRPTKWAFFCVGKHVRIKYASSNFCLHIYHME